MRSCTICAISSICFFEISPGSAKPSTSYTNGPSANTIVYESEGTPSPPVASSASFVVKWRVPSASDPGESLRRIATVPFTLKNLKEDLEDVGSRFDGAPDLEFRLATQALELEQSGLSYQRVPPGYRFPYGHTHKKQEEVYVVARGGGRMKLDDEIVELKEWDVVRVPPGTWRGYEAGPWGLEIIVIGAPNLGEAPREDVEGQRDWWAD
jgi:mannose-6-phosphate isomerase-like protein (cupin superfamily)